MNECDKVSDRRDEVIERMLATPPQPKPSPKKGKVSPPELLRTQRSQEQTDGSRNEDGSAAQGR